MTFRNRSELLCLPLGLHVSGCLQRERRQMYQNAHCSTEMVECILVTLSIFRNLRSFSQKKFKKLLPLQPQ